MSAGKRMPRNVALHWAQQLVALLSPSCERIEIAGSLRRGAATVGDIELVAIPKMVDAEAANLDLFTPPTKVSALDQRLDAATVASELGMAHPRLLRHPVKPAWGPKYKKLWLPEPDLQVDVFAVTPPAEWGPALLVRTGPAEFVKRMVTRLRDFELRCEELAIQTFAGAPVACPTEDDFFRLCRMHFIPPEKRRA